jgi:hypothetical protein
MRRAPNLLRRCPRIRPRYPRIKARDHDRKERRNQKRGSNADNEIRVTQHLVKTRKIVGGTPLGERRQDQ